MELIVRNKLSVTVALAALLLCPPPAAAHRLDEMLQATHVALGEKGVRVELYLSPGAAVASSLLTHIDRDGDGQISPVEQQRFAKEYMSQLFVTIDGRRVPLRVQGVIVPDVAALRDGTGEIHLTGDASVEDRKSHTLLVTSGAATVPTVYQANVLQPASERLQLLRQIRDVEQRTLRVEYSMDTVPGRVAAALVWMPIVAGMAVFVLARRRRSSDVPGSQG